MKAKTTQSTYCMCFIIFLLSFTTLQAQLVTSGEDDGADGTLRAEISDTPDGGTITFDPSVTMIGLNGELIINKNLTITGNGITTTTIDGNDSGRIFNVNGATLIINDIALMNGTAEDGGGLHLTNSDLTLTNVDISSCTANGASGSGGAIFVGESSQLTVLNSSFSENLANRAGGAIEDQSGESQTISITGSDFSGNNAGVSPDATAAPGNGGAIHITGPGNMAIIGSTFENNIAAREGGALWNGSGLMTVASSTLNSNVASGDESHDGGGAIFNNGGSVTVSDATTITNNTADGNSGSGGAVLSTDGPVEITDSTLDSNMANRAGAGIELIDGSLTVTNSTLSNNSFVDAAPGNGGALHVSGAAIIDFVGGEVSGNTATSEGGGLWNQEGSTMTVSGTEISDNIASGDGADNGGGGLFNNGGTLIVNNGATITNNTADGASGSGGGVFSTDGSVEITDSTIDGNMANRAGAGIELVAGSLTVTNSSLTNNSFAEAAPGNGGALHVSGVATIDFIGGEVSGNTATSEGGGLWNQAGSTMTVSGTDISSNTASGDDATNGGGGLFNNGGTLIVDNGATISENIADGASGSGGGIQNVAGGTLTVTDSEISGNSASRAGGGIEDNSAAEAMGTITLSGVTLSMNTTGAAPGNGGGMHITGPGMVTITDGTIDGNTAANEGGGLWNGAGTMTITGTTISGNTASGDTVADPMEIKGGGGIFANDGGTLIINEGTTVSGNFADGAGGSGGGILMAVTSTLTINGTEGSPVMISGNAANRAGGGIEDWSLDTTTSNLTNVEFTGNSAGVDITGFTATAAPGNGGAIHITGPGDMNITGGMANENLAAAEGGAFWNNVGTMSIDGTVVTGNTASGDDATNGGGGLFNNGGTMMVANAEISENIADGASGSGGGIQNVAGGTLTVTDSEISGNSASRAGGGIEDNSAAEAMGTITLSGVTLSMNTTGAAPGNGGGMHITGPGMVTITDGTIDGNTAANEGGGLWNGAGTMTITGTTISGNTASGDTVADPMEIKGGGGIFANDGGTLIINEGTTVSGNFADGAGGSGGGILMAVTSTLTINGTEGSPVMISGNAANRAGGGIEDWSLDSTTSNLTNVEFTGNSAGVDITDFTATAAPGNGGAIHITGPGDMNITGGMANENLAAAEGGAFWNNVGTMSIDGTVVTGNTASGDDATNGGGGLFNNGGTMMVANAEISENIADGASGSGGGIQNVAGGTLTVDNSMIMNNMSNRAGGGIEDNSLETPGSITITNTMVTGNSTGAAPGNGGGLHITGPGDATITSSTFNDNTAVNEGGAIWNGAGITTLMTSTISGNSTDGDGGGLFNLNGTLDVNASTIALNTAAGTGGGVDNADNSPLLHLKTLLWH